MSTAIPPEVARRAVEWLVELQSDPVSERLRREWSRWRAADPLHEQAWQRIEAVNGRFAGLGTPATAALAQAALAPRPSVRRRQAVRTLALVFFAGGTAWTLQRHAPWREWTADLRTGPGERRRLTLEDGTRLVLNTRTAVDLRYGDTERRLRLLAGELLIDSGKDPRGRPLLVGTAQGDVLALGTRFVVRQDEPVGDATADEARHASVSVFDGRVRLLPRADRNAGLIVPAGAQSRFSARTAAAPTPVAEDCAAAWVDGMLVARGMRLDDFVAELGRYSAHPLRCDPAVAQLRVSGTYPLGDVGKVLETVAATLSLEVQIRTRFWGRQVESVGLAPRSKG